jgi:hypothetical protein
VHCVLSGIHGVAPARVEPSGAAEQAALIRRFGDEFSPSGPNDGCTGPASGGNERPKDRALAVAGQRGRRAAPARAAIVSRRGPRLVLPSTSLDGRMRSGDPLTGGKCAWVDDVLGGLGRFLASGVMFSHTPHHSGFIDRWERVTLPSVTHSPVSVFENEALTSRDGRI